MSGLGKMMQNKKAMNALCIGALCSLSYLAVYFARNTLGAIAPHMGMSDSLIGNMSSVYFLTYAIGQLINGYIGDRIKARYMISGGLLFAGIANLLIPLFLPANETGAVIAYGVTGFFLSMIYGPMTKIVAENTEPVYATRCSLGYEVAGFVGAPAAGLAASVFAWQGVIYAGSAILTGMAMVFFAVCAGFERKGIVRYNRFKKIEEEKKGGIKVLIERRILKFTVISIITGVIRTTVVFWMPTYFNQYLGFSAEKASAIFAAASVIISFTTFISVGTYELLKRNMDLTILIMFTISTVFFSLLYFVKSPYINIVIMVIAVMSSCGAASMMWCRYCPSLRDTGMVSSATGYLDFLSYMAAAASTKIFSNAASVIGWGNLILVWAGLMAIGIIISLPTKKHKFTCLAD
ncbi:MAG: MFS transporter [Clostridia bacterium]|nr:MFS transporter [Clostridia bacterium]